MAGLMLLVGSHGGFQESGGPLYCRLPRPPHPHPWCQSPPIQEVHPLKTRRQKDSLRYVNVKQERQSRNRPVSLIP